MDSRRWLDMERFCDFNDWNLQWQESDLYDWYCRLQLCLRQWIPRMLTMNSSSLESMEGRRDRSLRTRDLVRNTCISIGLNKAFNSPLSTCYLPSDCAPQPWLGGCWAWVEWPTWRGSSRTGRRTWSSRSTSSTPAWSPRELSLVGGEMFIKVWSVRYPSELNLNENVPGVLTLGMINQMWTQSRAKLPNYWQQNWTFY